ncbi:MAG: hypothetical protein KAS49_06015 [Candidatus Cloacimonetes bacterium]|nr:hypothetical protein [Candidatus Cloacimonadota bacterium]
MFYNAVLNELMKDKTNPVNQMYLHEIELKWKEVQKAITEDIESGQNNNMISAINDFVEAISNQKYRYDKLKRKGFHSDSQLFSSYYIGDILTVMLNRTGVLENHGVKWGFQKFDCMPTYVPENILDDEKIPNLESVKSSNFLMLTVTMDFQYRIEGRRTFEKSQQVFPLIIFGLYKSLDNNKFDNCEEQAMLAKKVFPKSKFMIIAETLREDFVPDVSKSHVDSLFVLRKQFLNIRKKRNKIALDVVNVVEKKVLDYLNLKEKNRADIFKSRGILE